MLKLIGVTGMVILIILTICLVPALAVWVINSISESGGSSFRIEHGVWNYFLMLLLLGLIRGGKD